MKKIKIVVITFLTILVLINLPFLPGPNFLNGPAQLFFTVGQIFGMLGVVAVPFGMVWIAISKLKEKELFRPLLFTSLFLAPLVSILFLTNLCRDISRDIAIRNGNKLVKQIERSKDMQGYYPEILDSMTFEIPKSWIIGVEGYHYVKTEHNFELVFYQNILFGFNFEIVRYNARNEHKAEGELTTLHPTFDKHWKYEIFD